MAGESNADVYASLGANSAVMTSGDISEHEQNMLAANVAVRDGDDSIVISEEKDLYDTGDKFADEDEGRMQVRINGESGEATLDGDNTDESEDAQTGEGDVDFTPLGETPDELTASADLLGQHEVGFQSMVEQAASNGLAAESIARIHAEYEDGGISEESFAELAKAGYSKQFIESYISGQEALVDKYVGQIKDFAGGDDKFTQLITHLETNDAATLESLYEAMGRRDMSTVKALLNAAGTSRQARFGKPAARTVTTRATQSKSETRKVDGFESQGEMVAAMSDPRYRSDAKFRQEVERKVSVSNFAW